ncbi:MAG: DUF488 family protein [Ectothiorhodospiraceae bacterium]|nr:DUF488 family protein [Ectothiorhodospiraceae bacterium]MCH8503258.1 DUF488 family protein [Ectothiorhodospiraceae bacterium]
MLDIHTKRVYEIPDPDDGLRVLVDRVWPRGMRKDQVQADAWVKDLAPSTGLRKWFGHDRERWGAFRDDYFKELDAQREAVSGILGEARQAGKLTLLFAARDPQCNHAVALQEYLRQFVSDD